MPDYPQSHTDTTDYVQALLPTERDASPFNPLVSLSKDNCAKLTDAAAAKLGSGQKYLSTPENTTLAKIAEKNQATLREQGEHTAYLIFGAVTLTNATGASATYPMFLRPVEIEQTKERISVQSKSFDEPWEFNPYLAQTLTDRKITDPVLAPEQITRDPQRTIDHLALRLGPNAEVDKCYWLTNLSHLRAKLLNYFKTAQVLHGLANQRTLQRLRAHQPDTAPTVLQPPSAQSCYPLPADKSQLLALGTIEQGDDCQIESPPGTDTPQLIVNAITAALYQGKKVIFVCEAQATNQTIERHLSRLGLKGALVTLPQDGEAINSTHDLIARLAIPIEPQETTPFPFDRLKALEDQLDQKQNEHLALAHPALGITKQQALCGLITVRHHFPDLPTVPIPGSDSLTHQRVLDLFDQVQTWSQLPAEVITDTRSPWNSVFADSKADYTAIANRAQNALPQLKLELDAIEIIKGEMASCGLRVQIQCPAHIDRLLQQLQVLLQCPHRHRLLLQNPTINKEFVAHLRQAQQELAAIRKAPHPFHVTAPLSPEQETALRHTAREKSWGQLVAEHQQEKNLDELTQSFNADYLTFATDTALQPQDQLDRQIEQIRICDQLQEAGVSLPPAWWVAGYSPTVAIENWQTKRQHVQDWFHAHTWENQVLATSLLNATAAQLEHLNRTADHFTAHPIRSRITGYPIQQARQILKSHGITPQPKATQIQEQLFAVQELRHRLTALLAAGQCHPILTQLVLRRLDPRTPAPDSWYLEPELEQLLKAAQAVEMAKNYPDLFQCGADLATAWANCRPERQVRLQSLRKVVQTLRFRGHTRAADAVHEIQQRKASLQTMLSACNLQCISQEPNLLVSATLAAHDKAQQLLPANAQLEALIHQAGNDTELQEIIDWKTEFQSTFGSAAIDTERKTWATLNQRLQTHCEHIASLITEINRGFDPPILGRETAYSRWETILTDLHTQRHHIHHWQDKRRWQHRLHQTPEIAQLWELLRKGALVPQNAGVCFAQSLLLPLLPCPEHDLQGRDLQSVLNEYRELRSQLQSDTSPGWWEQTLRAQLHQAQQQVLTHPLATEIRTDQQNPRQPLPPLLDRWWDYLLQIKPCWLATPSALVHLCNTEKLERGPPFDLLLIDQAAQIELLNGLAVLPWAKQLVLIGDPQQLPPITIAQRYGSAAVDPDKIAHDLCSESLLGELGPYLKSAQLNVHYRSETPDLIAFNNHLFYQDRLEVPPPPNIRGTGRTLIPCAGQYLPAQATNPIEANKIVELILTHFQQFRSASLGVIIVNRPQRELIAQLLTKRIQTLPALTRELENKIGDEKTFFLKDLENIQRDEMDRILLGLTYGPDPNGSLQLDRHNPLGYRSGERRLNVATSRSRQGLTIVSSMNTALLRQGSASAQGFHALLELHQTLEPGDAQLLHYGLDSRPFARDPNKLTARLWCDCPFEALVIQYLTEHLATPYNFIPQYGSGTLRIDIAVMYHDQLVLAILCDGAAYHQHRLAQLRDQWRHQQLQRAGWTIHHLWSTNWLQHPEEEKHKLASAIQRAAQAAASKG